MREQTGFGHNTHALQSSRQYADTSRGIHSDDHEYTTASACDLWEPPRLPRSARRYQGTVQQGTIHNIIRVTRHTGQPIQRASRLHQPYTHDPHTPVPQLLQTAASRQRNRSMLAGNHSLLYLGGVLFLFLVGWFLMTLLLNGVSGGIDQLSYGYPRTYQTDKDVGHGGVSHFTAENLQGHIFVTELPNYDPSRAKIYVGQTLAGTGADIVPVTLSFADVSSDGLLDMEIIADNTKTIFLNGTDGTFHQQQGR